MSKHVVYTLDHKNKPGHFLAVVESDEVQDVIDKWWKAFYNGEKAEPREYNGISHRPVADFEGWVSPEEFE